MSNLLLFLSDRCNMACDYCWLDLNHGKATVLTETAGRQALRAHWEREPGGGATFLGGEPLVHFALLKELAAFARKEGPRSLRLNVTTNGALLDAARLEDLRSLGVGVTVSVDGAAAAHDRHRKLTAKPAASSWQAVASALPPGAWAGVRVNLVVSEDTVDALLAGVETLRRLGVRRLSPHLNVREPWSEAGLATLRQALSGFVRYARTLGEGFEIANLSAFAAPSGPEHGYDDVVLGADGQYYPCDGLFARPYATLSAWRTGDASSGVDWAKRAAFHASARAFIHAQLKDAAHYSCPREAYFLAQVTGADAAPVVKAFHQADTILGGALAALSRERSPEAYV